MEILKPKMETIKPKIIEISPKTVDSIRPRKLFFSIHNEHQVTFSKGLTADLGKFSNVMFGYDEKDVYLWGDKKGFRLIRSGSSFHIQSTHLAATLLHAVNLKLKMRYYVTMELDGPGIPRYKVMFSAPCSTHKNEIATPPPNDGSYTWEAPEVTVTASVDVRGEQAHSSSQPA